MQPSTGNTQPNKRVERPSQVVRCPQCGHHNPPGQRFCGACGSPLQGQSVPRQNVNPTPVAKPRKSSKWLTPAIIGTIITTLGAVLVAVIGSPILLRWLGGGSTSVTVHARIADGNGTAISNAKVTLFLPQGALLKYSDTDGGVIFENVESKGQTNSDLIVEASQYQTTKKEIPVTSDQTLELRLSPLDPNSSTIFIRVVDDASNKPVEGAEVELIVSGNNFTETTDTNGIAPYNVSFFSSDTVDADLTVNSSKYNINRQRVSLLPNSVQDVRLSNNQAVVQAVSVLPSPTQSVSNNPSSDAKTISFGNTINGDLTKASQLDKYKFAASANDVVLIRVSRVPNGTVCAAIALYGPDGVEIRGNSEGNCSVGDLTATLPTDGNYTIIISEYNGAGLGQYDLTIQKLN